MANVTSESAFEDSIEAHLLANGWLKGDPSSYDRSPRARSRPSWSRSWRRRNPTSGSS